MKHVLLLGAGFTCNWGGWNASRVDDFLSTVPAVRNDRHVLDVLTRYAGNDGFEEALAELEDDYDKSPTAENKAHLETLQSAIRTMFLTMEKAYKNRPSWEFCNDVRFKIAAFLNRFDAIFSLNQDLLPECHYRDIDLAISHPRKWNGWRRPGIKAFSDPTLTTNDPYAVQWTPVPEQQFVIDLGQQPFFKLHGAWNWRSADNGHMLVMGGNKAASIGKHPLLRWYHSLFESYMSQPNSRLMVIGYGFRDAHINETIARAASNNPGMMLFLVDPAGRTILPPEIAAITNMGVSRPYLSETFAGEEAEHTKLMSFFI